jgi:hypothetical protein
MPKRLIAGLIAASLAVASCAGEQHRADHDFCHPEYTGHPDGSDILVGLVVLPIWLATCYSTPQSAEATRAAAEKGDAQAQYKLGTMFASGQGVPGDDAEAARWYQRSADQGFGEAQFALALMYETGRGVTQDNVKADAWYTIAASAEKKIEKTTAGYVISSRNLLEARMTPDQIAEARKRAQDWKANSPTASSP